MSLTIKSFLAPLLTRITVIKVNQPSRLACFQFNSLHYPPTFFKSNVRKCSRLTLPECNGMSSQWKGEEHGTELLLALLHQPPPANARAVVMVALTVVSQQHFFVISHLFSSFSGRLLCRPLQRWLQLSLIMSLSSLVSDNATQTKSSVAFFHIYASFLSTNVSFYKKLKIRLLIFSIFVSRVKKLAL